MRRKNLTQENYLEKKPVRNCKFNWTTDEQGIVTIEVENKGIYNRIAQKLLKKPKISYVHLDEMGSFIWQLLDGEKDIILIGKAVEEHFGEKAMPLYERLSKYITILDSYGFVAWGNE